MDLTLPILSYDSFEAFYGQGAVAKFARFMCELFDAWVEKNAPAVSINSLENLSRMIAGGASRHCNTTNCCDRYITVEPNGDVGICENARVIENTDNNPVDYYLTKTNIATHSFDEIEQAVAHNFSVHEYNRRGEICLSCSVKDICQYGAGSNAVRSCQSHLLVRSKVKTTAF